MFRKTHFFAIHFDLKKTTREILKKNDKLYLFENCLLSSKKKLGGSPLNNDERITQTLKSEDI